MTEDIQTTKTGGGKPGSWIACPNCAQREGQIFMILALVIGALTGLAVVAFIVLTERLGMRLYPSAELLGGACYFRSRARSPSAISCISIFRMRAAAACANQSCFIRARWPHHPAHGAG